MPVAGLHRLLDGTSPVWKVIGGSPRGLDGLMLLLLDELDSGFSARIRFAM